MTLHDNAVRLLQGWEAPTAGQDGLRGGYLDHLAAHPDGLWKDGPPAHLTASCFVLDPSGTRTLLTHHAKGGFWVQLGGHCERADAGLAAVARREGREESGIPALELASPVPVDLDRHPLSSAFGRCREHLDVAFVAVVDAGTVPQASPESINVAWFRIDALPTSVPPDLAGRLKRVAQLLRHQRAHTAAPEVIS